MLFILGECGGVSVDFIYGVRERAVFFCVANVLRGAEVVRLMWSGCALFAVVGGTAVSGRF